MRLLCSTDPTKNIILKFALTWNHREEKNLEKESEFSDYTIILIKSDKVVVDMHFCYGKQLFCQFVFQFI